MIRRGFTALTPDERDGLAAAFNKVNDSGLIAEQAGTHEVMFYRGIHWRPQFLAWHRYFLRRIELALIDAGSPVALPYWDWTRADSRDIDSGEWKRIFGGRANSGGKFDTGWAYTRNGAPVGDLPTLDHVVDELRAPSFADYRKVEGRNDGTLGSHVHAHVWVGGSMAAGDSPLDPLFYLHHCNLDRLWSIWQINNAAAPQYDATTAIRSDLAAPSAPYLGENDRMPHVFSGTTAPGQFSGPTPKEMEDHRALGFFDPASGYGYPRDPELEARWRALEGTDLVTESAPLVSATVGV